MPAPFWGQWCARFNRLSGKVNLCGHLPWVPRLLRWPLWCGLRVREEVRRNIGHDGLCVEEGAAYMSAGTGLRSGLTFTRKLPARRDAQLGVDVGEVGFRSARGSYNQELWIRDFLKDAAYLPR